MDAPFRVCKTGHFLQEWSHLTLEISAREGTDFLLPDLPSKKLAGIQPEVRIAIGNSLTDQTLGELLPLGDD